MSTSSTAPALALYLHDGRESVFCVFHASASASAGGTAVLICPPFGWDDTCSYRSRRDWARQLAEAGFPCLRIDLPGTGDSGGSPHDPDRLATWTDAVAAAAASLRARTGCARVAAIGIGLGGLLICHAISDGVRIEEVVLWAVPARGRALLRELRTFASLEDSELVVPPEEAAPSVTAEGEVWVGGFVLRAETAGALEALDVSQLELQDGLPRRALLLGRDGIGVDRRLRERLEQAGASVTLSDGDGYGEMMARPHDARPPVAVFAEVSAWLGAGEPAASTARGEARPGEAGPRLGETAAGTGGASAAPRRFASASKSIELAVGRERVRETPIAVAQPFGELFGILAEPASGSDGDVCAVLLNAGAIRRIGPNRMWVEAARRWAALGVPTLRLDVEGIGDADGDTGRFGEIEALYVPALVDQVRGALDDLAERGFGPRFVLAGLCSGAYWGFHAALADDRVTAAYMLNPRALFWDPSLEVSREVRRALVRASAWRRVLRGEIPMRRMAGLAYRAPGVLARRALARIARRAARRRGGDRLDRAFDRLRDAGTRVQLIFTSNEPLYEELESEGRLARLDRWPNIGVELIAGQVHTLRSADSQASAHAALDRAFDVELQRAFGNAPSKAS